MLDIDQILLLLIKLSFYVTSKLFIVSAYYLDPAYCNMVTFYSIFQDSCEALGRNSIYCKSPLLNIGFTRVRHHLQTPRFNKFSLHAYFAKILILNLAVNLPG